MGVSNQSVG